MVRIKGTQSKMKALMNRHESKTEELEDADHVFKDLKRKHNEAIGDLDVCPLCERPMQ